MPICKEPVSDYGLKINFGTISKVLLALALLAGALWKAKVFG